MKKLFLSILAIGLVAGSQSFAAGSKNAVQRKSIINAKTTVKQNCNKRVTALSPFSREGKLVKATPATKQAPKAVSSRHTT